MVEQKREDKNQVQSEAAGRIRPDEFDSASRSLSEALRISFVVLKVIMIVLVILFFLSGLKTVDSGERALVLRFGKIRGQAEDRLLEAGLNWVFPIVEEIVKIPVGRKPNLPVNSFWYYQNAEDLAAEIAGRRSRFDDELNPKRDGYCITRSEKQIQLVGGSAGSDYNIVHAKWQFTYQIDDPESFFKNVYVDLGEIEPGQNYGDVIEKSVNPLLKSLVDDAVITAMVNYTIEEAIFEQVGALCEHVKKLLQEKLTAIESGVKVVSVQLTDIIWPRQVNEAFLASISASQARPKAISEARTYAENTLNEAAGAVAEELLDAIHNKNTDAKRMKLLWSQLAGEGQEKIAGARAYRTKVVETAKANADYLKKILPEYRKRPELVLQKIYQDAIIHVLENTDEKIIIQPTEGAQGETRIVISRDPTIKTGAQNQE